MASAVGTQVEKQGAHYSLAVRGGEIRCHLVPSYVGMLHEKGI